MTKTIITEGYTALREHAAWLDLSGRGKIRVTGEDRARLLHAMTSNTVEKLQPGEGSYAFFLSAQGRILADVNVLCFEDHFLLDTEPETRVKIYEHLDRYIIVDDVALEDATDGVATLSIEGPAAGRALAALGAPQPQNAYSSLLWNGGVIARLDTTGRGGFFLMIPAEEKHSLAAQLTAAGFPEATAEEARTVRIECGRPRYGEEITERYLVQETDQMHAVHYSKGCYLGQEIVERVRSRAQIHRVLRRLEVDTDSPPQPGTKLQSGDAEAAEIASAVYSPASGKTMALAYVRTPFSEPGTGLTLAGHSARVV
ncbi:MAG TPA: glycine cleavage T C-terminal barrel domain-containing protein [Bryobacteraceae bacterium]